MKNVFVKVIRETYSADLINHYNSRVDPKYIDAYKKELMKMHTTPNKKIEKKFKEILPLMIADFTRLTAQFKKESIPNIHSK